MKKSFFFFVRIIQTTKYRGSECKSRRCVYLSLCFRRLHVQISRPATTKKHGA